MVRLTAAVKMPLILISITTLLITLLHWIGVFDLLELKTYDFRMRDVRGPITGWLAGDSTPQTDVVLVEVDDEAWRLVPESWPYSRGVIWSSVIENLSRAGAKVIVFDIQFDTPEPRSEYQKEIWNMIQQSDSSFVPPMHGDSVMGIKIAEAEARGTKIILCSKIVKEPTLTPPEYLVSPLPVIGKYATDVGLVNDYIDADGFLRLYSLGGYMDHEPDRMYLPLGLKAIKAFQGISDSAIPQFDPKSMVWSYGENRIQGLANSNTFLINFYGPRSNYRIGNQKKWGTFSSYSVSQILDTRECTLKEPADDIDWMEEYISSDLPEWVLMIEDTVQRATIIEKMGYGKTHPESSPFYNKIVLVGVSVETIHDIKATPFYHFRNTNEYMPGVEVHAHAIQSILDKKFITVFGGRVTSVMDHGFPWQHFILILLICFCVHVAVEIFAPAKAFVLVIGMLLTYLVVSLGLFNGSIFAGFQYGMSRIPFLPIAPPKVGEYSFWMPLVFPAASVILAYLIAIIHRLLLENQKKNLLKESFGTYISPELIDEMYQTNHKPELGGVEGHRTAFFTDIVSFSSFSEILTPTQLVTVMNEYLSAMTDIILRNKGTLDKYIGDAIVAFWGAPLPVENQEILACKSACEMEAKLEELHAKWRSEEWPELICKIHHRIGIHSGDAVTGNMGSTMRMNYTMMGDTVNTAARLESSAKQYGIYVQVSESIVERANNEFNFMYLDTIRVKGKQVPIKTYELISCKENQPLVSSFHREQFEKGVVAYNDQRWNEAAELFRESAQSFPSQPINPAKVYLERCLYFLEIPPATDWDGVWTLTSK